MEKPHRPRRDRKRRGNRKKRSIVRTTSADQALRRRFMGSGRAGTVRDTVDTEWRMACLGTELLIPSNRGGCSSWSGRLRLAAAFWARRGIMLHVQCVADLRPPADWAISIKYNSRRLVAAPIERGFPLVSKVLACIEKLPRSQPNLIESYSRARDCQSKIIRARR